MSGLHGAPTDARYEDAGFGGRFAWGNRPAVVVVDLTRGFTDPTEPTGADLDAVVSSTRELVDSARSASAPVVFTSIAYSEAELSSGSITWLQKSAGMRALVEGSSLVVVDERLGRRDDEPVIVKKGASAFFGTPLTAMLTAWGCDTVIVCGATTSGCVRATAVDAVQLGFPVLVPHECAGDRADGPHDAALFDLQAKYADVISVRVAIDHLNAVAR